MSPHDLLREAIRGAALAELQEQLDEADASADHDWVQDVQEKIKFVKGAVLADYVIGSVYVDLGGDRDYHNVLVTDGCCSRHRSLGLATLTTNFLT